MVGDVATTKEGQSQGKSARRQVTQVMTAGARQLRGNQDDLDLDFFRGDKPSPCSALRLFRTGATAVV